VSAISALDSAILCFYRSRSQQVQQSCV